MDIIRRNFFRLLRSGAFDESEQIEPMSAWKWQRVYQYAMMHGVAALLYQGIVRCQQQFFLQIPPSLMAQWEKTVSDIKQENVKNNLHITELFALMGRMQLRPVLLRGQGMSILYDTPLLHTPEGIDVFFPYETQGKKADQWAWDNGMNVDDNGNLTYEWQQTIVTHHHRLVRLSNHIHSRTLHSIVEKEFRESSPTFLTIDGMRIEQLSPTLTLLHMLLANTCHLLNDGVQLNLLVDLGVFLRKMGDKVDYVKLQSWIARLRMKNVVQLTGTLLIELFAFSREELPFMSGGKSNTQLVMEELFNQRPSYEWHFQQGNDIFVHTANSSAMFWQVRHTARYFRYYPTESTTNLFTSFAHSLSHIEE